MLRQCPFSWLQHTAGTGHSSAGTKAVLALRSHPTAKPTSLWPDCGHSKMSCLLLSCSSFEGFANQIPGQADISSLICLFTEHRHWVFSLNSPSIK